MQIPGAKRRVVILCLGDHMGLYEPVTWVFSAAVMKPNEVLGGNRLQIGMCPPLLGATCYGRALRNTRRSAITSWAEKWPLRLA